MNRYFLVHDNVLPNIKQNIGTYHFIDLGSHGEAGANWNLFCLQDNHIDKPKGWLAFPHLTDSKTSLAESEIPHECLVDLGLTGNETTVQAIGVLGEIHPCMAL